MMKITHLNPDALHSNPAFSQGVLVEGSHRTLYIGGQNGVDADGTVVEGGIGPQTERALQNLLAVLAEAGGDQSNVVSMTIALVAGQDVNEGFAASGRVWGQHPTGIQVLLVSDLGPPDALVEVSAIAALPPVVE